MSLFENASLIVTPNAQKAGKLYSIKPTSGAGDLDVVRATSATRVNANGLIEIPRTNLVLRSEEFNDAYWMKTNVTVTANSTTSPSGTLTADTVANTSAGGYINNSSVVGSTGVVYSFSFYIKNNTSTSTLILVREGSSALSSTINWSGSIISSVTNSIGTINFTLVGNGWYRITGTYTSLENNQQLRIYPQSVAGNNSVFLWGAQLEIGNVATEYIPTTSSIRTRFAGITQDGASASNIPALDYTNGSCPSILIEPQRTNLLLRSEEFDNASWIKTNTTITSNTTISPSGIQNADKIVEVNGGNTPRVVSIPTLVIGTAYTLSFYLKSAERNQVRVVFEGSGTRSAYFNSTTGVVSVIGGSATASMSLLNNGWYRCSITITATQTNGGFYIATAENNEAINSGDNTKGIFIWGAQLEAGSNATSYIPTVASTVTRNADVISKTGISSLIGQTEGTIYWEGNLRVNTTERRLLSIIGTAGESQRIIIWTLNNLLYATFNAVGVNLGSFPIGTAKIAIGYTISGGNTTYSVKVNNNALITGTAASSPTSLASLALGSQLIANFTLNDRINLVTIWKTRLSNAELATLTTI